MNEFIIEQMENDEQKLMVKQQSTGWFYPNLSKIEAEALCEKLNEPFENESKSIVDFFGEWERHITELTAKETELINLRETYAQMEEKIISETDFKELYGRNNEQVRKAHIKNELKDLVDKKHDLQLRIDFLKRRIDFIKELMRMQGTLINSGVLE